MNGADVVNPNATLFGDRRDRWVVPEVTTLRMLLQAEFRTLLFGISPGVVVADGGNRRAHPVLDGL